MTIDVRGPREEGLWSPGEKPWYFKVGGDFTTPDPAGVLRGRSDQCVTILEVLQDDAYEAFLRGRDLEKRHRNGALLSYRVRFPDGLEYVVWESELYQSRYYLDSLVSKILKGQPL